MEFCRSLAKPASLLRGKHFTSEALEISNLHLILILITLSIRANARLCSKCDIRTAERERL